ncbi:MAG: hypothetical protein CBB97_15910 [Candidatus Endolissoclinum sp. TMED37]|nr:MAG: hypothetical protein CBB97_15910 [Candidatus Endolissoclinum sp. TMED37]
MRQFVNLPSRVNRGLFVADEKTGYKMVPNFDGTTGLIRVFTNSNGHRVSKPDQEHNQYKIVAFGDSFVFGHLTEYSETFIGILEKQLSEPILNAAVSGYNLKQTHASIKSYMRSNSPETVIVGIDIASDIENQIDDDINWISVYYGSLFSRTDQNYINVIRAFLANYSDAYYLFIEQKLKKIWLELSVKDRPVSIEYLYENPKNEYEVKLAYTKIKKIITEINDTIKDKASLIVILNPRPTDLRNYSENSLYQITLQILSQLNIPTVNLQETYENEKFEDLVLSSVDTHPNIKAHKLIGDALFKQIRLLKFF